MNLLFVIYAASCIQSLGRFQASFISLGIESEDCDAGDFSSRDVVHGGYRVLRAVPVCPLQRALSSLDELPQASSAAVGEEADPQTAAVQTPPLARSIADHRITAEHDFS